LAAAAAAATDITVSHADSASCIRSVAGMPRDDDRTRSVGERVPRRDWPGGEGADFARRFERAAARKLILPR